MFVSLQTDEASNETLLLMVVSVAVHDCDCKISLHDPASASLAITEAALSDFTGDGIGEVQSPVKLN